MGLLLKLSLLVATLCVLHVYGYEEENEYRRALKAFHLLQRTPQQVGKQVDAPEKRKLLDCKVEGAGCHGVPKCCGELQCYWEKGYHMFKDGECVKCVKKDQACQLDRQCCEGLVCSKEEPYWVDGNCVPKISSGTCYKNSQCTGECDRKWYRMHGTCTQS